METKNFPVSSFEGIEAGGVFKIYYVVANEFKVDVKCESNLMDLIRVRVKGGILELSNKSISTCEGITVMVSAPFMKKVELNGAADFEMNEGEQIACDVFELTLNGASHATLSLRTQNAKIDLNGAAHAKLKGKSFKLEVETNGASALTAKEFLSETAVLNANGASVIKIKKPNHLKEEESGASRIRLF